MRNKNSEKNDFFVKMNINQKVVNFQMDSGATVNVMSLETLQSVIGKK